MARNADFATQDFSYTEDEVFIQTDEIDAETIALMKALGI